MYNRKWGRSAKCKVIAPILVLCQCEGSELSIHHLTVILNVVGNALPPQSAPPLRGLPHMPSRCGSAHASVGTLPTTLYMSKSGLPSAALA